VQFQDQLSYNTHFYQKLCFLVLYPDELCYYHVSTLVLTSCIESKILIYSFCTYLFLWEHILSVDVVAKISSFKVIDEEVKILSILECSVHVDDKAVVKFAKYLALVENRIDTFFCYYFSFIHDLHSIYFPIFLLDNFPHPPKPTFPNDLLKLKQIFMIWLKPYIHS